jgi:hypothetical protein
LAGEPSGGDVHAWIGQRQPNDQRLYTYGYDAEGNLTSKTKISGGENWTFGYDHRNLLTSVAEVVSGVTQFQATYSYDVLGRRSSEQRMFAPAQGKIRLKSETLGVTLGQNFKRAMERVEKEFEKNKYTVL